MSILRQLLPILVLPALWAASGCGSRSSTTPAVPLQSGNKTANTETAPDGSEILLWGNIGEEAPRTYRIASDGSGKVFEEIPGIWIATSKGELHLVITPKPVVLEGCWLEEDGPKPENRPPVGEGHITSVELKTPEGKVAQTPVEEKYSGAFDLDQMEHEISVLGTIGPIIFLHEQTFIYACGAHGNTNAGFVSWDAEVGAPIDLLRDFPNKPELAKKAAKMLNEQYHEDDSMHEDDSPELVQLVPSYGPRGTLMLSPQLTRSACYACGDGLWSSYSQSAVLDSAFLPERLKPYGVPPVSVKVFLDAHPNVKLGGYSHR